MTRRSNFRDLAAVILLAFGVLGFFWRVVTGQNWMPADGGDLVSFLYPTYRFAAASLRDGAWPLWNPHLYTGTAHVGDIQAGFLYPPNLVLFLIKPDFPYAALQWLSMAYIWLAGVGMYLLLARGFALRRIAALAGAVAFMFADPFLTHFGNLNLNAAAAWLPWIFWAWITALRALLEQGRSAWRSVPRVMLTGALLAMAISAGHIQAILFTILALAAYTALVLYTGREEMEPGRRALTAFAGLAAVVLIAGLLAAPLLLPALQLAARTGRADWSYTATAGYSLAPAQLIGWLIPGFFGRGPQFHWGAWPRVEMGYLGILTLVLAGLALLLYAGRDRRTSVLAGLALAGFVLALGIYAIPHGWLTLIPGFGQMRAPARFIWITDFALAALAASGLHAVLARLPDAGEGAIRRAARFLQRFTGGVWLVAVPLAYLALLLVQGQNDTVVLRTSITLIAVVTFSVLLLGSAAWLWLRRSGRASLVTVGWLAVALIFLDLASLGAYQDLGDRDPSLSYEQPAIAGYLSQQSGPFRIDSRTQIESLWQPNTALMYGFEDVTGVANPLVLADFERYWGALGSRSTGPYDLLNVRYVIAAKDVELDWDKFALAFDGDADLNVYENRRALPRAFIVPHYVTAPTHERALEILNQPDFDVTTTAVVEGPSTLSVPAGSTGTTGDFDAGRNRLSFSTSSNGAALVFVSQVWYPGWRAYIDGEEAGEPYRVDYLFQGVTVPGGEHQIELRYEPLPWRWGWLVAGLTLVLAVFGLLIIQRMLRRWQ